MLRQEYLRRLVDNAHIELYLSANDGARIYWPWRMQPPSEASRRYRDACEKYIIDSDPWNDGIEATEILNCAFKLDAEIASLQDVYLDKDGTVDKLLEGLEIADSHSFDGQLLLPLQKPYVECWKELGEPTEHMLGIGGLKDGSPEKRIRVSKQLRNAVGNDVWIHGFGWGIKGIAKSVQKNPKLIDSIDYSTPMQNGANYDCSSGKERMSVAAMGGATKLVRDLREVGGFVETTAKYHRSDEQSALETF